MRHWICLAVVMAVSACTGGNSAAKEEDHIEAVKLGADRAYENARTGVKAGHSAAPVMWVVNQAFNACPQASDWFEMQDALLNDRLDVDLPSRCYVIQAGTVILAPDRKLRKSLERKGVVFEQGALMDGTPFWADGMDDMALTRQH